MFIPPHVTAVAFQRGIFKKILEFVQANGKIQNNDVERVAGVSNATAERYLDELEKEGKLTQHGTIGQSVSYTIK